jgi:hypothetical protein
MILALGLTVSNVNPRATLYLGGTNASLAASWYSDEGLATLAGRIPNANDIVEFRGASRTITGGFTCYMLKLTQSSRTWTVNCDVATFDLMLITGNSVSWTQAVNVFTGNIYCAGDNCSILIDVHELIPGMISYDQLYIFIAGYASSIGGNTAGLLTTSGTLSYLNGSHYGDAIFSGQESYNNGDAAGGKATFSGQFSNNQDVVSNDAYFLGAFSYNDGNVNSDAYVALGAGLTGIGDIGGIVSGTTTYPYTPP